MNTNEKIYGGNGCEIRLYEDYLEHDVPYKDGNVTIKMSLKYVEFCKENDIRYKCRGKKNHKFYIPNPKDKNEEKSIINTLWGFMSIPTPIENNERYFDLIHFEKMYQAKHKGD